jgi:hypothetical protein
MNVIQLASWRRLKPLSVAPSAGASGTLHAVVLALALFGYPVIDIVFGPSSGIPGDVLAYGESDRTGGSSRTSALDIDATDSVLDTGGGVDTDDTVPTSSSGDHAWDVEGDAPNPQTRAGNPDS